MRLPESAHTSRPWRIHEIAPDFRLEDVWALPTPGGREDFPRLVRQVAAFDPSRTPAPARALFAIREAIGRLLELDRPQDAAGAGTPSLRERLPLDLRDTPIAAVPAGFPATPLYSLDDEWAAEIANRTVHGVIHLGWVPDGTGGYRGQLAVLVKPNGLLGASYMVAIAPFRHLIVYPTIMRQMEQAWQRWADAAPDDLAPVGR